MNVLVAFDKFKDSLSAHQACEIVADELRQLHPDWKIIRCPLADGGDGFARILTEAAGGRLEQVEASGPRGKRVTANAGVLDAAKIAPAAKDRLTGTTSPIRQLAVIEMAAASGLALLKPEERNVFKTQTRGTGEMVAWARDTIKADGVMLGLGGSATHDLGLGALAALGVEFIDENGRMVADVFPDNWQKITAITIPPQLRQSLRRFPLWMACDVSNPLLGPQGAAAVYARQKGLREEDFPRLESETERMGKMLCSCFGYNFESMAGTPGAGAAGGIAFGLMVACGARLTPGFDLVADWLRLPEHLANADLVITGEGCFDRSSLSGKGPGSLVHETAALGKATDIFAGRVEIGPDDLTGTKNGDINLHEISPRNVTLSDALRDGAKYLRAAVRKFY